jgi:hypothetical protein
MYEGEPMEACKILGHENMGRSGWVEYLVCLPFNVDAVIVKIVKAA